MFLQQAEDETPRTLSPIERNSREDTARTPDESTDNLHQEHDESVSPTNENITAPEDGEVKKKKRKKKKKTKQNKTAPIEEEESYELPPLNAWDSPPGTLNGFPGKGGMSPRRLEPLGPPRLPGTVLCLIFSTITGVR